MTLRATAMSQPPDEDWVDLRYSADGSVFETRIPWRVFDDIADFQNGDQRWRRHRAGGRRSACLALIGLDLRTELVRAVKKKMFAPGVVAAERRLAAGEALPQAQAADGVISTRGRRSRPARSRRPTARSGICASLPSSWNNTTRSIGDDFDEFFSEVQRVLSLLPRDGLILDVRGNGGGYV